MTLIFGIAMESQYYRWDFRHENSNSGKFSNIRMCLLPNITNVLMSHAIYRIENLISLIRGL